MNFDTIASCLAKDALCAIKRLSLSPRPRSVPANVGLGVYSTASLQLCLN